MTRSSYIAYVTILSELMSVMQSILTLNGLSLHYVSLIFFGLLSLPALARVSFSGVVVISGVIVLQFLKSFLIGVGPEFSKAFVLIIFAALLILIGPQMLMSDFIKAARRLRWYIVVLGLVYVVGWVMLGSYRNASTFSLAIMVFLGFQGKMRLTGLLFLASAKTLFQILSFNIMIAWCVRSMMARTLFVTICVLFAALAPVLLVVFITPEMVIFTASHTASLFERLLETHTFLENIQGRWSILIFGDQIGWVLESNLIEARGYLHANHLWLVRTFGIPIWLIGIFLLIRTARHGSWQVLGVRTLILTSQAFLMTLFTSPFLTMLLLCRVSRDR